MRAWASMEYTRLVQTTSPPRYQNTTPESPLEDLPEPPWPFPPPIQFGSRPRLALLRRAPDLFFFSLSLSFFLVRSFFSWQLVHALYVDLLSGLRRSRNDGARHAAAMRRSRSARRLHDSVSEAVQKYADLLKQAIDPEARTATRPAHRRKARLFALEAGITPGQHRAALASLGWTEEEWSDGMQPRAST